MNKKKFITKKERMKKVNLQKQKKLIIQKENFKQ